MWNSNLTYCINRMLENQTCNYTNECYSPMICSSFGICQCTQNFTYFNLPTQTCIAQGTYLSSCSIEYNCRVDKYLSCISGFCQCISAYPVWSSGYNKCIIPHSYSENCTATSDCATTVSLVCSTGTSCTCPLTLLSGKCDCPVRVSGNETYWNGAACTQALSNSQPCFNSSTNYMCQTLTQGTTCSGGFCSCSSLQFFNITSNKCETLVSINGTCTQVNSCDASKGLSCQTSLCQCNSTQFWDFTSSNMCINRYSYNQGACASSDQCQPGLVCKLSGSGCNCSTVGSVANGKCDCPVPTYGNESYWNGTMCAPAKTFNQSCISSWRSYECQQITQGTLCSGNNCICNTSCTWNSTTCVCCSSGWFYHRGSCFIKNSGCSTSFSSISVGADCNGPASTRLAILQNSDATFSSFVSKFANDYWFDAMRANNNSVVYYSSLTPGYSITYSSIWDLSSNLTDLCATFDLHDSNSLYFRFRNCLTSTKNFICEYVM